MLSYRNPSGATMRHFAWQDAANIVYTAMILNLSTVAVLFRLLLVLTVCHNRALVCRKPFLVHLLLLLFRKAPLPWHCFLLPILHVRHWQHSLFVTRRAWPCHATCDLSLLVSSKPFQLIRSISNCSSILLTPRLNRISLSFMSVSANFLSPHISLALL